MVILPPGQPQGKPKACNYGLIHARGEYVVIYDAEDIPEPDQLKKAVVAFRNGGSFFAPLINPLFWFLTVAWFATRSGMVQMLFPAPLFYLGTLALFVGNFTFTYVNIAGTLQRGYYDLAAYALLTPIYWALMSVAAWKGLLQLFYAPSYWEKTRHGLYKTDTGESAAR